MRRLQLIPEITPRVQLQLEKRPTRAMSELLGWYGYEGKPTNTEDDASPRQGLQRNFSNIPSPSNNADEPRANCWWCGRHNRSPWEPEISYSLSHDVIGEFCSASCLAAAYQRRQVLERAFKRRRCCDWCRHVRTPLSYVHFQDGERLLQFCSDKCLNRYKMNIFCRETETHLALYDPSSLPTDDLRNDADDDGLITPDLWLRNCPSPPNPEPTAHLFLRDDVDNSCGSRGSGDEGIDTKDNETKVQVERNDENEDVDTDGENVRKSSTVGDLVCHLSDHLPIPNCQKCLWYARQFIKCSADNSHSKPFKFFDASLSTTDDRGRKSLDASEKVTDCPTHCRATPFLPALAVLVPYPIPIPIPIPLPLSPTEGTPVPTANISSFHHEPSSDSRPLQPHPTRIDTPSNRENARFRTKRRRLSLSLP